MVRYRVLISGRVQGAFFRDTCRRLAESGGVAGWVRNPPTAASKRSSRDRTRMSAASWPGARSGPRLAAVADVAVQPEPPEGLTTFQIK